MKLILASASPRRQELLQWTYLPFQVLTADIEETSEFTNPKDIVCDLAEQKASAVAMKLQDSSALILAADTIVVLAGKILGKPKDINDAQKMLEGLSGKTHQVLTGVCLQQGEKVESFYRQTDVTFRSIEPDLLKFYLETGESLDKAGAYGIQGAALGFIHEVKGSYSNVVGLPVDDVLMAIKKFLGHTDDLTGEWRKCFQKV